MTLNVISLFGLFVMIGLSWLMSSHRDKVNWRLVVFGVILQLVFAAVFFNSQNWKFSRNHDNFEVLLASCDKGESKAENVPLVYRRDDNKEEAFATGYQQFKDGTITASVLKSRYWNDVDAPDGKIAVPRFKNGVVFYVIESFFDLIKRSVDEGAKFVFNVNAFPDEGEGPTKTALFRPLPLACCQP